MKLTCPACGATASLDVLIGHEGARDAVMVSMSLPAPLGGLLVQYLGLFRPPQRNLSLARVAGLLQELKPLIADAKIERGGRIWSAPQDYWKMALEEILAKRETLTLPLKTHGYLLTIIAGYSSKAEAKQESAVEARRAGNTQVGATATSKTVAQVLGKSATDKPAAELPEHLRKYTKKGSRDGNQ